MPDISCPDCGLSIPYAPQEVGRRISCSTCGLIFTIPSIETYQRSPSAIPAIIHPDEPEEETEEERKPDKPPRRRRVRRKPPILSIPYDKYPLYACIAFAIHLASGIIGYVFLISAAFHEKFVGLGCISIFLLIGSVIAWLIAYLFATAWVVGDTRARGANSPEIWIVVLFLAWIVGVLIYLLTRQPGRLRTCASCRQLRLEWLSKCPHCGH